MADLNQNACAFSPAEKTAFVMHCMLESLLYGLDTREKISGGLKYPDELSLHSIAIDNSYYGRLSDLGMSQLTNKYQAF